ncbi:MAG: response regulator transcription factor [Bacteroidota bacterium]
MTKDNSRIKVVLVDDSAQLRSTLIKNLSLFNEINILYTAENGADLFEKLKANAEFPEVILMDVDMPVMNGIQATLELHKLYGESVKVIMLTVFDDDDKIFDAILAGATGYLIKEETTAKIVDAIKNIIDGGAPMSPNIALKTIDLIKKRNSETTKKNLTVSPESYNLTPREVEVLELLSVGKTYKQIADQLFVSDKTIKKHIENIYNKLHVNSKMEAVFLAQKYEWYK